MVMIPGGSRNVGDMEKAQPLPEATYNLRIDKVEIRRAEPSVDNPEPDPYLNLMLTVIDEGAYLGRKVFDICTLGKGKDWKLRKLLTEGLAWGEDDSLSDTTQLEQAEVGAAVTIEKGKKGYEDRNKVVRYMRKIDRG